MALKDRIRSDNTRIFMNREHFADVHTWNGLQFVCVADDTEALKRKNNNVVDVSFEANTVDKVIFVPEDSLPGRAQPNEQVVFDGVLMKVMDVIDAVGMKEIHLSLGWSKGVQA